MTDPEISSVRDPRLRDHSSIKLPPHGQKLKSKANLGSYYELIQSLSDKVDIKGAQFERVTKWILENDPRYTKQLDKVWHWSEWPERWGADCGIDLIAQTKTGEIWAVQCKAVDSKYAVRKSDIDSFLSESSRPRISFRLLVCTTDKIGGNARSTIDGQEKPVGLLLAADLASSSLGWPSDINGLANPATAIPLLKPRAHQKKAIKAAVEGYKTSDRGKVTHACGTGKSLTAMWTSKALAAESTIVSLPSLALVKQTLDVWTQQYGEDFHYLVVCSDPSTAAQSDKAYTSYSRSILGVPVTTDASAIKDFLAAPSDVPKVVFSTTHSLRMVGQAQKEIHHRFAFGIGDEAHTFTGLAGGAFTHFVDDSEIAIDKRLFMTATERFYSANIKKRAAENDLTVLSMDDETKFGPTFDHLSFRKAITKKLSSDYQIIVCIVTKKDILDAIKRADFIRLPEGDQVDAKGLAIQMALLKAIEKYKIRKMITLHRTVARAKAFTNPKSPVSLAGTYQLLNPDSSAEAPLNLFHINGRTRSDKRTSILDSFANSPQETPTILSNCNVLRVGVDIAPVDCVAFCDPRRNTIDIAQIVGRAMRNSPGKKIGYVAIPVFLDEDTDPESASRAEGFNMVWDVLRTMRAHDEVLAEELDQIRTSLESGELSHRKIVLPSQIVFDLPKHLPAEFSDSIQLQALRLTTHRPKRTFSLEAVLAGVDRHFQEKGTNPNTNSKEEDPDLGSQWSAINLRLRKNEVSGFQGTLRELIVQTRPHAPQFQVNDAYRSFFTKLHEQRNGEKPHYWSGTIHDSPHKSLNWMNVLPSPWHAKTSNSEEARERFVIQLNEIKVFAASFYSNNEYLPDLSRTVIDIVKGLLSIDGIERPPKQFFREPSNTEWIYETLGLYDSNGFIDKDTITSFADENISERLQNRARNGHFNLDEILRITRKNSVILQSPPLVDIDNVIGWISSHFEEFGEFPTKLTKRKKADQPYEWPEVDMMLHAGSLGLVTFNKYSVPLSFVVEKITKEEQDSLKALYRRPAESKSR